MAGLQAYALTDTRTINLFAPGGAKIMHYAEEDTPVEVVIRRRSSDELQRLERKQLNKRLRNMDGKKLRKGGDAANYLGDDPAQDTHDGVTEALVCAVVSWEGLSIDGSAELPCTPETVRALVTNPKYPFVREQLAEAIDDDEEFLLNPKN